MPLFSATPRNVCYRDNGYAYIPQSSDFLSQERSTWFDSLGLPPLRPRIDEAEVDEPDLPNLPTKEDVLHFFMMADEDDALWVLESVSKVKEELMKKVVGNLNLQHAAADIYVADNAEMLPKESKSGRCSTRMRNSWRPRITVANFDAMDKMLVQPPSRRMSVLWNQTSVLKEAQPSQPSKTPRAASKNKTLSTGARLASWSPGDDSQDLAVVDSKNASSLIGPPPRRTGANLVPKLPGDDEGDANDAMNRELREVLERRRVFVSDPVVQFSSFMSIFEEGTDSECTLEVIRIGNLKGRSEVRFITEDTYGGASHKFDATNGTLIFEPGESTKILRIPIIDDEDWGTTAEFIVKLLEEDLRGARLDKYLKQARVKVIDDEAFPTNRFKTEILSDCLEEVPKFSLLYEYFKLNYSNIAVRDASIKMVIAEQVHLVELILRILMNLYLVDHVLNSKVSESSLLFQSRHACLAMLMVVNGLKLGLAHFVDRKKITWRVAGLSRATLQAALLTKYLNYDDHSRAQVRQGDIILGVTRDSHRLVDLGYLSVFALFYQCLKILALIGLRFGLAAMEGKKVRFNSCTILILLFPLCNLGFGFLRSSLNTNVVAQQHARQNELAHHIEQTVANYRIIADFHRRPFFIEGFKRQILKYNNAVVNMLLVVLNNSYFSLWLVTLFVSIYTYIGGMSVVLGSLTLGSFMADIHILTDLGHAWGVLLQTTTNLQMVIPDLERIVAFLNLNIDLRQRKRLDKSHRNMMSAMLAQWEHAADGDLAVDALPIVVENPGFKINLCLKERDSTASQTGIGMIAGLMNIDQGLMISLVGPRGGGKSTLLRIIGGVNLPSLGEVGARFFIPTHLRVLHVSTEPLFFHGTLFDNVSFGASGTAARDEDATIYRAVAICRLLGLPRHILQLVEGGEEGEVHAWWAELSQSQKHLLCIARALVANPEVLCIHKPVQVFDRLHAIKVLELMKKYVTDKGIVQDVEISHLRRPRTCIFTSSTMMGVELADQVFHVSSKHGIQELDKPSVTVDMLG